MANKPETLAWIIERLIERSFSYPIPSSSIFPGTKLSTLDVVRRDLLIFSWEFDAQNIRILYESQQNFATLLLLEVQSDRAFITVYTAKIS